MITTTRTRLVSQLISPPFYAPLLLTLLFLGAATGGQAQSLSVSMTYPAFRASFITGTDVTIRANATAPAGETVKIQGFEIEGNNAALTLPEATTQPGSCDRPTGTVNPKFNGNGISLSGRTGGNLRPHHVVLANNVVHDCSGGGIIGIECDYVTLENNTIYNTSWYTIYGTSGISFLNCWNYDINTSTPKIIIRNNRTYGNRLFMRWNAAGVCKGITDGNGIILDNNNDRFGANPLGAYNGKFLVENNVSYLNGGRGIQTLKLLKR